MGLDDSSSYQEGSNSTGSDQNRSPVDRRTVIKSLGGVSAAGGLGMAFANGPNEGKAAARQMELSGLELPTWQQTEKHEAADTPQIGRRQPISVPSVVTSRTVTSITRSISHVNMKLWENDDVAYKSCGNNVGHQHRFIASMLVYTAQKGPLSNYFYDFPDVVDDAPRPLNPGPDHRRNPPVRGLHGHDSMTTWVRIPDDAPNNEACGSVAFRINNAYWNRLPLTDLTNGETLYGEYGVDDLKDDVSRFQNDREEYSPYMPEDDAGLLSIAESPLGEIGPAGVSLSSEGGSVALDAWSGYDGDLVGSLKTISSAADYAGILIDSYVFLGAIQEMLEYEGQVEWQDNDVKLTGEGSDGGSVAVQYVDFTVTVPPGETNEEGTIVAIDQDFGLSDVILSHDSHFEGQRPDENGHVLTDYSWEIEIPGYSADDFSGISESNLPTIHTKTNNTRTRYDQAPQPDPSIKINRSGTSETDPITFEAQGYRDDGNSTYRWRVYKNGGRVQPATFIGPTAELEADVLKRGREPILCAFGPGQYVVELSIRNQYGKTGGAVRTFTVDPAEKEGTTISIPTHVMRVTVGETAELSADGSVGYDGTEDTIDLVEWEIQYPAAVTGGVRANEPYDDGEYLGRKPPEIKPPWEERIRTDVEHTFEHVGIYRATVAVFSLGANHAEWCLNDREQFWECFRDKNRGFQEIYADKRDITVVVMPRTSGNSTTATGGSKTSGSNGRRRARKRGNDRIGHDRFGDSGGDIGGRGQ